MGEEFGGEFVKKGREGERGKEGERGGKRGKKNS